MSERETGRRNIGRQDNKETERSGKMEGEDKYINK
jgi:hypothetical protein